MCAFGNVGILVRYFVQCLVQMATAHVNPCLIVGWEIYTYKVICVPLDQESFMHMSGMLSRILLAAAPLAGKRPDLTTIPGNEDSVEFTAQSDRCTQHQKHERTSTVMVAVAAARPWTWCIPSSVRCLSVVR